MSTDELAQRRKARGGGRADALAAVLGPIAEELVKPVWTVPLTVTFCAKDEAEAAARVQEMREWLEWEVHILEVEPGAPPGLEDQRGAHVPSQREER